MNAFCPPNPSHVNTITSCQGGNCWPGWVYWKPYGQRYGQAGDEPPWTPIEAWLWFTDRDAPHHHVFVPCRALCVSRFPVFPVSCHFLSLLGACPYLWSSSSPQPQRKKDRTRGDIPSWQHQNPDWWNSGRRKYSRRIDPLYVGRVIPTVLFSPDARQSSVPVSRPSPRLLSSLLLKEA